MCFTPALSLTTALFEFFIATFVLIYYKKARINIFLPLLLYLLGIYQLTEYFLCTTQQNLWISIGFITYTYLPAIGLAFCLDYVNKKYNRAILFLIPTLFSAFVFYEGFVIHGTCGTYLVSIKHYFFGLYVIPMLLYLAYYFGTIAYITTLLVRHYQRARSKITKLIDADIIAGILLSLVPAVLLVLLIPSLYPQFPSLYCQFAAVFAVTILIAYYLDSKRG